MSDAAVSALQPVIVDYAQRFALPAEVVHAIVQVESGGNVFAWKVEPQYRFLFNVKAKSVYAAPTGVALAKVAPDDFPHFGFSSRDTEWWGQQSSWGPMQVMGAVAREFGYVGPFPALCSADNGIKYGCMLLSRLRDRYLAAQGWQGVVASFNAGSPRLAADGKFINQEYVDRITATGLRWESLP